MRVAAGLTALVLVAALVVVLLQSEPRRAGSNAVRPAQQVVTLGEEPACQAPEIVPAGAAVLELPIALPNGGEAPALTAELRDRGGRVVARGEAPAGARGPRVRIELPRVRDAVAGAQVCLRAAPGGSQVDVRGQAATTGKIEVGGEERPGAMSLHYLRSGSETWLAIAPSIAHRFAQAKTRVAGAWLFWVVLVLSGVAVAIGVRAGLAPGARVPAACAAIALLNGVAWSLLLPPLQSNDEPVHVYYTQRLAETGNPPRPIAGTVLSDEENAVINAVRLYDVAGNTSAHPPWTSFEDRELDRTLAAGPSRLSDGADGGVGVYPPLYYALGAAAYKATPGGSLLDRMEAMRLVSALLAAVAAFFCCLFARELLPGRAWAWAAAGVVAAFQPTFGYLSGAFNPDVAVTAAGAALFYAIARAYRRGLTPWLAVAIGGALAAGFLSKLAFAGLVPGAALAVLLLAWRQRAWAAGGVAALAAGVPVVVYALLNVTVWDRPALVGGSGEAAVGGGGIVTRDFNVREALVYIWQVHLPRLPFMSERASDYPLWDRYFTQWVGRFGWGDYAFPTWVPWVALSVGLVLLAAAIAFALRHRAAFVARWPEWLSYAAIAGGLLLLLAYTGYDYSRNTGLGFEQGRYLLPLHALYAGIVAAGLRGFGARAGPVAAAVLVVLAAGMSVWAQLLTIARFYG
jgi:hypothetical protein